MDEIFENFNTSCSIQEELDISSVNLFIQNGVCENISSRVLDSCLEKMLKYPSVKRVNLKINNIIKPILENDINKNKYNLLVEQLTKNFIPPGTKGVVKFWQSSGQNFH